MIERVISGGQTGADQAGWRAAKRFGLATGGWMPRGFVTEDGPRPEFAELYGAKEHASQKYPPRTRANARIASATLVFDAALVKSLSSLSAGSQITIRACMEYEKPNAVIPVQLGQAHDPRSVAVVADWINQHAGRTLNIAGNRESKSPGIGQWVQSFLCDVFRAMGLQELPTAPPTPAPNDHPARGDEV